MFARLKSSLGRIVSAVTLVSLLVGLALASSFKHAQLSSVSEIQSPNNVSELLERRASLAIRKSRNSAVNVMSISEEGTVSSSSGTYYTGYPNGQGPLTFAGEISGHDSSENVYVHSFAWPGSSGSGVFSDSGKLIGIIVAISVGSTEFGIDVLEDIVIVIPLYKIDWDML